MGGHYNEAELEGLRKLAQSISVEQEGGMDVSGQRGGVLCCVCMRELHWEGESGRDASWKMTAFNKYVGGRTLHYTE